jgi:hypothetical protein
MKAFHHIFWFVLSIAVVACSPGSANEKSVLQEAYQIHNEAVEKATILEEKIRAHSLQSDHAHDTLDALAAALEHWKSDLVEVPGFDDHDHQHDHATHDHNHDHPAHHAPAKDLTPNQILAIQREFKDQIDSLTNAFDRFAANK